MFAPISIFCVAGIKHYQHKSLIKESKATFTLFVKKAQGGYSLQIKCVFLWHFWIFDTFMKPSIISIFTCIFTDLFERLSQFDLCLYLSPELLHLPEVLHHLSSHDLYDGGGEGQAQEDVDRADHHVETFVW